MEKINPLLFTPWRWSAGSPADFGVPCREEHLVMSSPILRNYAVGWCRGESLACRPKVDTKAVMFFKDGRHFWFHLTNREFKRIFQDVQA